MAVARRPRPRTSDEDERPEPRRRARNEDDEDERPARSTRARNDDDDEAKPAKSSVRKGWDGHKANASKGGDFAEEFRPGDTADLIKFLEDEPFASYRQHWVDNPPGDIRKKSWTCLEDDCPLCDMGDRPRTLTSFNVLVLTTGADPEVKVWNVGVQVAKQIEGFAKDEKSAPLDRLYYSVKRTGKGAGKSVTNIQAVKPRDLKEDWDLEPLEEDEVEEALTQIYDASVIQVPPRKTLREIAEGLQDED